MASGHRAHAASWRRHGHHLGHLGHLGHCFLLQAGASMAAGHWVIWVMGFYMHAVIWVIWVMGFYMTQMTQKLAPACATGLSLWVIWVILSCYKNWWRTRRVRAVPNLLGYTLISKSFIFLIRINDPNDPKHNVSQYWRALALGSFFYFPWPINDPNDPTMQNMHNVKISVDNAKQSLTIASLA
jgi:hypothetical protein